MHEINQRSEEGNTQETPPEPLGDNAGVPNETRSSVEEGRGIIDPFSNVHETLARPLETGPVGKKVVPFKVPVMRRPPRGRWCTIHPDPKYRLVVSLIAFGQDDVYLVHPYVAPEVEAEDVHRRAIIHTAVLRPNCAPFLWYIPLPNAGERDNDYWRSARTAAEAGMGKWIRVISDMDAKCYHYEHAPLHTWPERWPDVPLGELLRRGFQHPGRYIDNTDHPVIRELHGETGSI